MRPILFAVLGSALCFTVSVCPSPPFPAKSRCGFAPRPPSFQVILLITKLQAFHPSPARPGHASRQQPGQFCSRRTPRQCLCTSVQGLRATDEATGAEVSPARPGTHVSTANLLCGDGRALGRNQHLLMRQPRRPRLMNTGTPTPLIFRTFPTAAVWASSSAQELLLRRKTCSKGERKG